MREFKFRAWDKNVDKMFYNDIYNMPHKPFEEGNNVIMQYTGLKDMNGVEIYEGDIIFSYSSDDEDWLRGRGEVRYKEGCFYLKNERNMPWSFLVLDKVEVIGNIFENPEIFRDMWV